MMPLLAPLLFIALLVVPSSSFTPPSIKHGTMSHHLQQQETTVLFATNPSEKSDEDILQFERRKVLAEIIGAATLLPFQFTNPNIANAADNDGPITIIGANGKTGSECVGVCLSQGIDVVATSRGGSYTGSYASDSIKSKICDVTEPETIASVVKGSRAVIFAASASKAGGTPSQVDYSGLVNVANACLEYKVPSLVIVSSGGVSKPDSPVYKFLNIFGKIMEEKIKGEDMVRNLYKDMDTSTCTYTIIRPGGLTEEEPRGVNYLELNQGDTKSGRIARADVAALCVAATMYPKLAGGTTFECYDADTAKPLQTVGISNILKQTNKEDDGSGVFVSGKEHQGNTFEDIFTGLDKD